MFINYFLWPICVIAFCIIGFFLGFYWIKKSYEQKLGDLKALSAKMVQDAKRDAANIKKEAHLQGQDLVFKMKSECEKELSEKRLEQKRQEDRLTQKEESLDRRSESLAQREAEVARNEAELVKNEKANVDRTKELQNLIKDQSIKLETLAQMTKTEAKELLLKTMEEEARHEGGRLIRRVETEAREIADKKSKEILALAVKRYASDYVAEHTISVVNLPNEEMKGRIIGREGRNIRAIEATTGVDLIIDDTPEAVILSSFSPIRREIARQSLERLIVDGRIHPARIEEVVSKISEEMEQSLKEIGKEAAFDVGVHGIHHELVKLLGKLKYRTSYAQNVLQHSMEVAFLCGIMAAELGQNVKQAKRAGLLHDIGKAVDHEVEGPHGLIGAELAKRYGESPAVVHAIMAHHEDTPPESVLDVLVQAADSLSGARPGARREMLETYVKRLEDLERIANSFSGISKTFAIQAGREIRIMVNSDQVTDESALTMANDICRQVEKEMVYPGQIKVTVIRETRAVAIAK
ncbi:MAG: ribonuclease Y [Deltaproteobacteria bacterium]|jgi:ribonuclease Y|nr:ribonuclease Y [Deltaproteobacteria bacterium]